MKTKKKCKSATLLQVFVHGVPGDTNLSVGMWVFLFAWIMSLFFGVSFIADRMCGDMANSRGVSYDELCMVSMK